jgi:hypothetical protein
MRKKAEAVAPATGAGIYFDELALGSGSETIGPALAARGKGDWRGHSAWGQ